MEKSRNSTRLPGKIQEKHTVGRRDFFKGAAAGAAALVGTRAGGGALVKGVAGGAAALVASHAGNALAAGVRSYTLTASEVAWPVGGGMTASAYAYSLDGGATPTVPGPTLEATEGETLQITVVNNLPVETTVHWHGVHTVPNGMDGVPGVTQDPIPGSGGSFIYTFPAPAAGTYVYHSHFNTPEQVPRGLYGLLVVRPRGRNRYHYDREFSLVLGTFPGSIVTGLPAGWDDVELINGRTFRTLADLVEGRNLFNMSLGDRVLFRIWNSSSEVHPMHTHGMHYDVVAADSMHLEVPLHRDTMGVNAGERYDIIAHADNPGTWLFHCHNLDHVLEGMIAANVVTL